MRPYPTDTELAELIREIEKAPLSAPGYLKEEILKSLEKQDTRSVSTHRQKSIQMFTYSMKIMAGVAAALFLIVLLPQTPMDYQRELPEQPRWELENKDDSAFETTWHKGSEAIKEVSDNIMNRITTINHLFNQED